MFGQAGLRKIRRLLGNGVITSFQFVAYLVLHIPIHTIFRSKRVLPKNIGNLSRGSLLVANHQSMVDPVVIMGNLPFRVFWNIVPVRFPTDHDFMKIPVLRTGLRLLGCYDVGATPKARACALLRTCELLRENETILLFPEGSIAKFEVKEFLHGIEFFLRETQRVIFIRMDGFNDPVRRHIISNKRKLVFGNVCDAASFVCDIAFLRRTFFLSHERVHESDHESA